MKYEKGLSLPKQRIGNGDDDDDDTLDTLGETANLKKKIKKRINYKRVLGNCIGWGPVKTNNKESLFRFLIFSDNNEEAVVVKVDAATLKRIKDAIDKFLNNGIEGHEIMYA